MHTTHTHTHYILHTHTTPSTSFYYTCIPHTHTRTTHTLYYTHIRHQVDKTWHIFEWHIQTCDMTYFNSCHKFDLRTQICAMTYSHISSHTHALRTHYTTHTYDTKWISHGTYLSASAHIWVTHSNMWHDLFSVISHIWFTHSNMWHDDRVTHTVPHTLYYAHIQH